MRLHRSDRTTTITIPLRLLDEVDARLARLSRRQRVSFSGYIEAALKELFARGEEDVKLLIATVSRNGVNSMVKLREN